MIVWPAVIAAAFLIVAAIAALAAYLADDPLGVGLAGVFAVVSLGWAILAGRE